MAFTRFHDDPARIIKALQQSTDQGLYYLNQPGLGEYPCYINDPQIISQKWGGNYRTNAIELESSLRGLNGQLTRDCKPSILPSSQPISYPLHKTEITSQSRATNPAWTTRGVEKTVWGILPLNPQENVEIPFHNNLNTRIIYKDEYTP